MKVLLALIIVALINLACCGSRTPMRSPIPVSFNRQQPSLDSVVKVIQNQYFIATEKLKAEGITNVDITGLEVSLSVTKTVEADGSIKVLIFKPTASYGQTRSTSVTYVLSKEEPTDGGAKSMVRDDKLSDAIVQCATKFNNLSITAGKLVKDNFSLDISFSVKWDAGGRLEFDLWGIGADIGAQTGNEVEHALKLTFELKKR